MKKLSSLVLLIVIFAFTSGNALAKDDWIEVRSKNFLLLGNASEKDIKQVAVKMEQFRETFKLLFPGADVTGPRPTTIIVFKSKDAYKPFLPRRSNGKADNFIAGYFMPGEDVNYITLSTEGEDEQTFKTIFHEYVHFIIDSNFGRSEVPAWFNEGLAEYYSTFRVKNEKEIHLGFPIFEHTAFLANNKLMPLEQLFNMSNRGLHSNNTDKARNIFYAESWVLIHYLMQQVRDDSLSQFLRELSKGIDPKTAFHTVFKTDYSSMETQLRKYVNQNSYKYQFYKTTDPLTLESEIKVSPLSDADTNAYLGDLLYHSFRYEDAVPYLERSLAIDPASVRANTAMGMSKLRLNKFEDSKKYLYAAARSANTNYLALYSYAYLLQREGMDAMGQMNNISPETAKQMRVYLVRSINLKPQFSPSSDLLAYLAISSGGDLDEALKALKLTQSFQPGDQKIAMRIAEVMLAKKDLTGAADIAEKIAETTDDESLRQRAKVFVKNVRAYDTQLKEYEKTRNEYSARREKRQSESSKELSEQDIEKINRNNRDNSINRVIRRPVNEGESILRGTFQKIECVGGQVRYTFLSDGKTSTFASKDFQNLELNTFISDQDDVGCNSDLKNFSTLVIIKNGAKPGDLPTLIAISFVPNDFVYVDKMVRSADRSSEQDLNATNGMQDTSTPENAGNDQRTALLEAIRGQLRKPAENEVRMIGTIEGLSCGNKEAALSIKTASGVIRVRFPQEPGPQIKGYTREIENIQFECRMGAVSVPVVFIYRKAEKENNKSAGDLVSLEFVPTGFTLD